MHHSSKPVSWKSVGKLVSKNRKTVCSTGRGQTFITCFTCSPWLQILSRRSQRLAIKVFSSTPVMFTSPCPSSTASRPIFSTSILLVYKKSVGKIRHPQLARSHSTREGCGQLPSISAGLGVRPTDKQCIYSPPLRSGYSRGPSSKKIKTQKSLFDPGQVISSL